MVVEVLRRFAGTWARRVGVLDERSDAAFAALVAPLTERQRARLAASLAEADLLLRAATVDVVETVPSSPAAVEAMTRYFAELADRFGFTGGVPDAAGRFFLALDEGLAVAGGGLRTIEDGRAEVKRLWVDPAWRGAGLGARLLRRIEAAAAEAGHAAIVLDTNSALDEAIALYDRAGYRRIDRYNDNPDAELFFEKSLR